MKLFLTHICRQKDLELSMKMGKNKISGTLAKPSIHMANKIFSQNNMKSVHLLTLMQLAFMQVLKESDGFFGFKYTLLRGSKSTRKMEINKKTHSQKISKENQRLPEAKKPTIIWSCQALNNYAPNSSLYGGSPHVTKAPLHCTMLGCAEPSQRAVGTEAILSGPGSAQQGPVCPCCLLS